jgi:predicted DNA-binding transcriptional regulator AlpA
MTQNELFTAGDLQASPAVVDLMTAARAFGLGRTTAYQLARRGEFPCRLIRVGASWRVPTAELARVLGVEIAPRELKSAA